MADIELMGLQFNPALPQFVKVLDALLTHFLAAAVRQSSSSVYLWKAPRETAAQATQLLAFQPEDGCWERVPCCWAAGLLDVLAKWWAVCVGRGMNVHLHWRSLLSVIRSRGGWSVCVLRMCVDDKSFRFHLN